MRDDELETLLRAYRQQTRLSPATEDRILARVQRSAADLPEEADTAQPRADVPVRWIALGLAVAAALALLWIRPGGFGVERRQPGTPDAAADVAASSGPREVEPPRGAQIHQPTGEVPPSEATLEDASPRQETNRSEEPSSREQAGTRSRSRDRTAAPTDEAATSDARALAAEAALLRRANASLSAGDAERAFTLLQDWERQFAPGHLHEEHAALRAIALCELGRSIQGRGEAKAFGQRYTGSALAQRVRNACAPEDGEKKSTGPTPTGQ